MKAILIKHLPEKGKANRTFNAYFPLLSSFEVIPVFPNRLYKFALRIDSSEALQAFRTCIEGGVDMQGDQENGFPIDEDELDCFVIDESDTDQTLPK